MDIISDKELATTKIHERYWVWCRSIDHEKQEFIGQPDSINYRVMDMWLMNHDDVYWFESKRELLDFLVTRRMENAKD